MDYRLSHFGAPNLSGGVRPILYVVYGLPWFLDERNFFHLPALSLPAQGAPSALTPLLAAAHRPAVEVA
jgi:hypothetical protein